MKNKFCKVRVIARTAAMASGIIICSCFANGCKPTKKEPAKSEYYVVGNIFPGYYDEPLVRHIWTEGTGSWEIVKRAKPLFEGHYQPKVPLWGYELCDDPKVVERWIDTALEHGVNVFMYDWYWFNGGPFLEGGLNDGFLKAKNNEKMLFYIIWSNHDADWNVHHADEFWSATVDWKNWQIIVDRVIKQYFGKPNYLKLDGKPVFAIFSLLEFLKNFEGEEEGCRKALNYFDEEAKKAGFPGVHFQLCPPHRLGVSAETIESIGFHSVALLTGGGLFGKEGIAKDYLEYGENAITIREQYDKELNIPFFPTVSTGYDDSSIPYDRSPFIVHDISPEAFGNFLAKAKKFVDDRPEQPKLIILNAWNEWTEDGILLPCEKYGFGYLEAVRDAMNGKYDE